MDTIPQPSSSAGDAAARDVLADAAHVFLAAQQPVMVESLRPRPADLTNSETPVAAGASVGAPDRMLTELDDLAGL